MSVGGELVLAVAGSRKTQSIVDACAATSPGSESSFSRSLSTIRRNCVDE